MQLNVDLAIYFITVEPQFSIIIANRIHKNHIGCICVVHRTISNYEMLFVVCLI